MDTRLLTIPGYRVYDYLIVLNLNEDLRNRIKEIQKEFNQEFKVETKASWPNLLLARFSNFEMKEDRIINRLNTIAMAYPPFKIELKDFGSFPSHTIYIPTVSKIPIQNLVKEIRSETQRLMKLDDEHKPFFMLEPHITIARKLKPWQYEAGWLKYSHKHFTGRFIADSMILLKRNNTNDPWHPIQKFEFKNMPIITKQGDLFG